MKRPQGDPTAAYLAALQRELRAKPSELIALRQISRASDTARRERAARRSHATRVGLLALVLTTLVSTSGVAVAGGLPHRVQGMVADAARLLPVPVPIPYPAPTTTTPADPTLEEAAAARDVSESTEARRPDPVAESELQVVEATSRPDVSDSGASEHVEIDRNEAAGDRDHRAGEEGEERDSAHDRDGPDRERDRDSDSHDEDRWDRDDRSDPRADDKDHRDESAANRDDRSDPRADSAADGDENDDRSSHDDDRDHDRDRHEDRNRNDNRRDGDDD